MEMTLWKQEKWLGQKCGTCWRSENCQNLSYPSSSLMIFYSLTQFSSSHPLLSFLELSEENSFSTAWLPLFFFCFLCQTVGIASPASVSSSPASRPFAFLLHFQRCLHHHFLPISHYSSHSHPLFPFLSSCFFPSPLTECCVRSFHPQQCEMRFEYGSRSICGLPKPPSPSPTPIHVHKCTSRERGEPRDDFRKLEETGRIGRWGLSRAAKESREEQRKAELATGEPWI